MAPLELEDYFYSKDPIVVEDETIASLDLYINKKSERFNEMVRKKMEIFNSPEAEKARTERFLLGLELLKYEPGSAKKVESEIFFTRDENLEAINSVSENVPNLVIEDEFESFSGNAKVITLPKAYFSEAAKAKEQIFGHFQRLVPNLKCIISVSGLVKRNDAIGNLKIVHVNLKHNLDFTDFLDQKYFYSDHQSFEKLLQSYMDCKKPFKRFSVFSKIDFDFTSFEHSITKMFESFVSDLNISFEYKSTLIQEVQMYSDSSLQKIKDNTLVKVFFAVTCLCLIASPLTSPAEFEGQYVYKIKPSAEDVFIQTSKFLAAATLENLAVMDMKV